MSPSGMPDEGRHGQPASKLDAGLEAAFGGSKSGGEGLSVLETIARRAGRAPKVLLRDDSSPEAASPVIDASARKDLPLTAGRGNYQLLGEIASGGMGTVMKGHDLDLGRDVALKVLHEKLASDPAILQRFVEEAQIGGQLQHPGIVPVYELGLMADDRPFFTMKLVKGRTLGALLKARKSPGEDRHLLLNIFESICQTVAYAHSKGVIHRDLKPANVMVGAFGEVQVVDWGLAKVLSRSRDDDSELAEDASQISVIETVRSTDTEGSASMAGSVLGTPAYMPPEQAQGEVTELDERADVFALGAVLAVILTGQPPYVGPRKVVLNMAARGNQVEALERLAECGADPELIELCRECLSADMQARPTNAGELAARVTAHLASLAERAQRAEVAAAEERVRATEALARAANERHARRLTLGLAASILVTLILGGAGWAWVDRDRSERLRETTEQVGSALDEANLARVAGDWTGALAATERAQAAARSGGATELEERAHDLSQTVRGEQARSQHDTEFAEENTRIQATLLAAHRPTAEIDDLSWVQRDAIHRDAFLAAGLAPDEGSEDQAFEQLGARGISQELATELDLWTIARAFSGDGDGAGRLARIAKRLDPNPVLERFRDRIPVSDYASFKELVKELTTGEELAAYPPSTLALLGQALWVTTAVEEAIALLDVAIQQHPGEFSLLVAMGSAQLLGTVHEPQEALHHLFAARALRPDDGAVWSLIGLAYMETSIDNASRAMAACRRAVELDPDQTRALSGLVNFSFFSEPSDRPPGEELVRAARHLNRLHESNCVCLLQGIGASCTNTLATALYQAERWDEGIEVLERSMDASGGGSITDWLQLAEFYLQLGDPEEGRIWYERSKEWIRTHPVFSEFYWGASVMYDHATELFEGER